ncbi:hypothetical protein [Candidatus Pyrohabitans sp.]
MGFSTTAAHAIFFIAAVVVATGVAGVVSDASQSVSSSISQKSYLLVERLEADIEVVHVYSGSGNTSIYILNSGKSVLIPDNLLVFLNGRRVEILGTRILNRSVNIQNSLWDPDEILEVNITAVTPGRYSVKVLAVPGIWDEYYFNA